MAYTASALAFLLRGLGKPVVVTGSQIPLGVLRSDGRQNFLTAVLVAARDDVQRGLPRLRLEDPARVPRGQGERERLRGLRVAEPAAARRGGRRDRDRRGAAAHARARRDRAADGPRRAGRRCCGSIPGCRPRCCARRWRTPTGPRARGLRRRHRPGRRRRAARGARRGRRAAASSSPSCSQCVDGRVDLGAYATSAPLIAAGAVGGLDMTTEAAYAKLVVLLSEGRDARRGPRAAHHRPRRRAHRVASRSSRSISSPTAKDTLPASSRGHSGSGRSQ